MTSGRRAPRLEHRLTGANAALAELEPRSPSRPDTTWRRSPSAHGSIKAAQASLGRSRVRLGTVVGFPHGGQLLSREGL